MSDSSETASPEGVRIDIAADLVECLPDELLEHIFGFLSAKELFLIAAVSVKWREKTNTDALWIHQCLLRGWLQFGVREILPEEQEIIHGSLTNVSGTSPHFTLPVVEGSHLEPLCHWKRVFVKALHLRKNWECGRYTVTPIYRAHKEKVTALDCDGETVVSGSHDNTMKLWDVRTIKCRFTSHAHSDTITALAIKAPVIVSGCGDGSLRVFDSKSGMIKYTMNGHNGSIDHMHYDGETIISVGSDRTIKVWSTSSRKLVHNLAGHSDDIECLYVYDHLAVTGSWDNTLIVWDVKLGTVRHTLEEHSEAVNCCVMDRDYVVSGGGEGSVKLWSVETGERVQSLDGHEGEVYCVVYNGEMIASGSSDSTVRVWTITGMVASCVHVLQEHLGVVRCLYLRDDLLVSGGDRKKIVVWKWTTGQKLNVLHRNPTLLHLMWVNHNKIITGSPEKPGAITVLSFW